MLGQGAALKVGILGRRVDGVQPHCIAALLLCPPPAASSQRVFLEPSSPSPAQQGHHSLGNLTCCARVHQLMSHGIPEAWSLLSPPASHIDHLAATSQAHEHSSYKVQGMAENGPFMLCFSSSLFATKATSTIRRQTKKVLHLRALRRLEIEPLLLYSHQGLNYGSCIKCRF